MEIQVELLLLVISILFFVSILVGRASSRFGVPILLLFLGVGMLFGCDGIGIEFDNYNLAQAIGTVTLCIILFSGGMDTKSMIFVLSLCQESYLPQWESCLRLS